MSRRKIKHIIIKRSLELIFLHSLRLNQTLQLSNSELDYFSKIEKHYEELEQKKFAYVAFIIQ